VTDGQLQLATLGFLRS